MIATITAPTAADYQAAFDAERVKSYPMVDAFEQAAGFALDRQRLLSAASVLACPLKKSPPNWQHGRVLYAATLRYLCERAEADPVNILDIGTAKGFSALCLQWALTDSSEPGRVMSVDVIDPGARVSRKTIAEVDGLLTLGETLSPWAEAASIQFVQSTGIDWLETHPERVHIAFVDGSHDATIVQQEGRLLAARQQPGDLAIFDDVDRAEISIAVQSLSPVYRFEYVAPLPTRAYAIGVRQ